MLDKKKKNANLNDNDFKCDDEILEKALVDRLEKGGLPKARWGYPDYIIEAADKLYDLIMEPAKLFIGRTKAEREKKCDPNWFSTIKERANKLANDIEARSEKFLKKPKLLEKNLKNYGPITRFAVLIATEVQKKEQGIKLNRNKEIFIRRAARVLYKKRKK